MNMIKINEIMECFDHLIKEPKSELEYHHDYELLIAVVLSAQTTDKRVNQVTKQLYTKYNTLEKLSNASLDEIKNIISCIGMSQKKSFFVKNIATTLLQQHGGQVPSSREYLEQLSGVGRKTANVVLSILFNEPAIAVDTHVARVSKRLGLALNTDSVQIIEKKLYKQIPKEKLLRMHHQLLLFGRYYCTAKKPKCETCIFLNRCQYKRD